MKLSSDQSHMVPPSPKLASLSSATLSTVNAHLAAVVRYSGDAILGLLPDGLIASWNPTAERLFGYTAEEAIGQSISILAPPDRYDEQREIISQLRQGQSVSIETVRQGKSGELIPVIKRAGPIWDEAGQLLGISVTLVDITELKRAEAEARANEDRYRSLFKSIDEGFCVLEMIFDEAERPVDYRFLEANPVFERLTGLQDAIGKTARELIPDLEDHWFEIYGKVALTGEAIRFIDSSKVMGRWFDVYAFRIGGPTSHKVALVFNNITERKQAERRLVELAEEADRLRRLYGTILATIPDLVSVFDLNHCFTYANQALLSVWGKTWDEAIGRTCLELGYEPWLAALHDREIDQVIATKQAVRGEVPFHGAHGRRIYDYIFVPVLGADGNVELVAGTTRDVTESKQAEETLRQLNETLEQRVLDRTLELQRSNEELDRFAYIASHDLKAPLRAIDHLANWIGQDEENHLSQTSQVHLTKLRARIQRMNKLLDDLLEYSRAGRQRQPAELVDVALLARNIVDFLVPPPGFQVLIQEPMPKLMTERVPLETVLRNLLANAFKHHLEPAIGKVHVSAVEHAKWVEFSVQDNGPGIAPNFHQRIFEIFQTLKPRDEVEGSGVGLTVVKKLVEAQGGEIEVISQEGKGSIFRFTWPKSS